MFHLLFFRKYIFLENSDGNRAPSKQRLLISFSTFLRVSFYIPMIFSWRTPIWFTVLKCLSLQSVFFNQKSLLFLTRPYYWFSIALFTEKFCYSKSYYSFHGKTSHSKSYSKSYCPSLKLGTFNLQMWNTGCYRWTN